MDVNGYLSENIDKFNVKKLEIIFDLKKMGDLLDSSQIAEYLNKIENNSYNGSPVEEKPRQRTMAFVYYFDLSENGVSPSTVKQKIIKSRKSNQKIKNSPPEKISAKRPPKKRSVRSNKVVFLTR